MILASVVSGMLVDLYGGKNTFDHGEPGIGPSGICWASRRVNGVTVIVFRGSVTFWDWFKDFLALATPFAHETLGPIHQGFGLGMDRCWGRIKQQTEGPWIVGGHSLGAGRADIVTGLMIEDGCPPLARVVFGEPKPGFAKLREYIAAVPGWSFRNGDTHNHDLVTDSPITFFLEEYEHPTPLVEIMATPAPDAPWGVFKWHHMQLYDTAVQGIQL